MSPSGNLNDERWSLKATVVEYENEPNECTLHPIDPPTEDRTTAWITARGGSYVDLDRCR